MTMERKMFSGVLMSPNRCDSEKFRMPNGNWNVLMTPKFPFTLDLTNPMGYISDPTLAMQRTSETTPLTCCTGDLMNPTLNKRDLMSQTIVGSAPTSAIEG